MKLGRPTWWQGEEYAVRRGNSAAAPEGDSQSEANSCSSRHQHPADEMHNEGMRRTADTADTAADAKLGNLRHQCRAQTPDDAMQCTACYVNKMGSAAEAPENTSYTPAWFEHWVSWRTITMCWRG